MPNHVRNHLTVLGPPEEVARFVATARGRRPQTGDTEGVNYHPGEIPEEVFCFHALVPLPQEYSRRKYGEYGIHAEQQTWGVKWGAYDSAEPVSDPGLVTYRFTTAWGAPTTFLGKVAPKWEQLTLLLSWGGEGPTRGIATFHRGRSDMHEDQAPEDMQYPETTDENEDRIPAYDAVQNARLTAHAVRVAHHVAASRGVTFVPDAPVGLVCDWMAENGYPNFATFLLARDVVATDEER